MVTTGWLGSEEPGETPAVGFADFILKNRRPAGEGYTLEQVLARAARPDRAPEPYDDDDRQAALLTRGYSPGMISDLAQRLGDVMGEIEDENARIEKGKRRQEHLHRAHAAGQITAWDIVRGQDFDEGDPGRVAMLERRAMLGRTRALIVSWA